MTTRNVGWEVIHESDDEYSRSPPPRTLCCTWQQSDCSFSSSSELTLLDYGVENENNDDDNNDDEHDDDDDDAGFRSPRSVLARFLDDGLPSLRAPRRSFLHRRSSFQMQQEQQQISFEVYYQTSRLALMFSRVEHGVVPQQFEVCQCTLLLIERTLEGCLQAVSSSSSSSTEACLTERKCLSSAPSSQLLSESSNHKSLLPHDDSFQFHNHHNIKQQQHVLIVAEPGLDSADQAILQNKVYADWARQWAREELRRDVSAIYLLQQLPTELTMPSAIRADMDNGDDLTSYQEWRKLVQESLEQPMILQQVEADTCTETAEQDNSTNMQSETHSNRHFILSQPFNVTMYGFADNLDTNEQQPLENHDNMPNGHVTTGAEGANVLTKEGSLSEKIDAIMIDDAIFDAMGWESRVRLYRQLVEHYVAMCPTNEQIPELEDERGKLIGCLGKISLAMLRAGQHALVHLEPEHQGWTEECNMSVADFFQKSQVHHHASELTMHEYFAGQFVIQAIQMGDQQRLNIAFQQDLAARHSKMLKYVAAEVSNQNGLEGVRSLLALCRCGAHDVVRVHRLHLELQILHEWLTVVNQDSVEDEMRKLESEFHILESFKTWFNVGVTHMRKGQGQEASKFLISFLINCLTSTLTMHMPEFIEPLLEACEDNVESVRRTAADLLCEIAKAGPILGSNCLTILTNMCKQDKFESVRAAATNAIAEVVKATPPLAAECLSCIVDVCKDESKLVRTAATITLAEIAVANSLQCQVTLFSACKSDRNEHVRAAALHAFGKVAMASPTLAEEFMPTLVHRCKMERNHNVREAATIALAEVAQAIPKLAAKCLRVISDTCKKDRSEHVRKAATNAIADMAKAAPTLAARCLSSLSDACKDEKYSVRRAAIQAVGTIAKTAADLAAKYHSSLADACKEDGNVSVRRAAAYALGGVAAMSNPDIASKCRQTLISVAQHDKAEGVRQAAARTLGQLAKARPKIGPKCLTALIDACLDDKHPTVRKVAARALGMNSDLSELFLPAFFKVIGEGNDAVRRATATSALLEIAKVSPSLADSISVALNARQEGTVETNGGAPAVMERLEVCPELASKCLSNLLEIYQKAECHHHQHYHHYVRSAAKFFLGELTKLDQQKCLPFLLQAAAAGNDNATTAEPPLRRPLCEAAQWALQGLAMEQLIGCYFALRDDDNDDDNVHDALLSYIADNNFQTPVFTCTHRHSGKQYLVLYNTAGERLEWEDCPNHNVQNFVEKLSCYFQNIVV